MAGGSDAASAAVVDDARQAPAAVLDLDGDITVDQVCACQNPRHDWRVMEVLAHKLLAI